MEIGVSDELGMNEGRRRASHADESFGMLLRLHLQHYITLFYFKASSIRTLNPSDGQLASVSFLLQTYSAKEDFL